MEMSEHRTGEGERPLAHDRRRHVLYCLYLYTSPMKLADVAEQVLVWEQGDDPGDDLRERLHTYNDLYHEHLPVLRRAGLVAYDQRDDMVGLGPAASEFEPVLERLLSEELGDLLHAERDTFDGPSPGPFPTGLYRALADPERRRVLYYLLDRSAVSVDELADVLAEWRRAADDEVVDPEERAHIRADLRDVHLPLLERVGLVVQDTDAGTVRLSSLTEPMREVIRSAVPVGSDATRHTAVGRWERDETGGSIRRE